MLLGGVLLKDELIKLILNIENEKIIEMIYKFVTGISKGKGPAS